MGMRLTHHLAVDLRHLHSVLPGSQRHHTAHNEACLKSTVIHMVYCHCLR